MFFADPKDADLRGEDGAFLFGDDLLVVPPWVSSPKLPKGIWRDVTLLEGDHEHDGYQPALSLRGGAIIPLGEVVQNTNQSADSPLTLLVCPDADGKATGTLYEDAGDGNAYRKGEYALTVFTARREGDATIIRQERREGDLPSTPREIAVRMVGPDGIATARGNPAEGIRVERPR